MIGPGWWTSRDTHRWPGAQRGHAGERVYTLDGRLSTMSFNASKHLRTPTFVCWQFDTQRLRPAQVGYDPLIDTPNGVNLVHRMDLFMCDDSLDARCRFRQPTDCTQYSAFMHSAKGPCYQLLLAHESTEARQALSLHARAARIAHPPARPRLVPRPRPRTAAAYPTCVPPKAHAEVRTLVQPPCHCRRRRHRNCCCGPTYTGMICPPRWLRVGRGSLYTKALIQIHYLLPKCVPTRPMRRMVPLHEYVRPG